MSWGGKEVGVWTRESPRGGQADGTEVMREG